MKDRPALDRRFEGLREGLRRLRTLEKQLSGQLPPAASEWRASAVSLLAEFEAIADELARGHRGVGVERVPERVAPEPPARVGPAGPQKSERPIVLLAEDDALNQAVGSALLGKLGFEVDLVENGAEAVDAVFARDYDAVLLDWRMPVMDGLSAAREIRRREGAGRRNFLIATTANARDADRRLCLEAGMDDHVAKPLSRRVLARVLKCRGVDGARPESGAATPATSEGETGAAPRLMKLVRKFPPAQAFSMLDQFLAEGRRRLEELRGGAASGDAEAIALAAHALRGSGYFFGTDRLLELAASLEQFAGSGSVDQTAPLVKELEEELTRVEELVAAEQRRRGLLV